MRINLFGKTICLNLIDKWSANFLRSNLTFYCTYIKMKTGELLPPPEVRGMTVLDREKFSVKRSVPTIRLATANLTSTIKIIKKYLLKMDNFKPIQPLDESYRNVHGIGEDEHDNKLVYLDPTLIRKFSDFDTARIALEERGVTERHFSYHEILLTYDNWRHDEIIKSVLPADKEPATSYTLIGHVAHINLREHNLEYKNLIGQVILDKIKQCRTVVNKTDEISNIFRNFKFEVLCGENDLVTRIRQNGCLFTLDFSQVYWNTRLATEHERIIKLISEGDILFDVFAGVGPFSIPVAKKKCFVFANDLNPDARRWMEHNATVNKISDDYFQAFNLDGIEFIQRVFHDFLIELIERNHINFDFNNSLHITMNLPAAAVTFLKYFIGLLKDDEINRETLMKLKIIVHVYCFVSCESREKTARETVEQNLGYEFDENQINCISFVRSVAPNKDMMRVSFRLIPNALLGDLQTSGKKRKCTTEEDEPESKRVT